MIRLTKWDKGCFFLEGLQNKAKLSGFKVMIETILMHRFPSLYASASPGKYRFAALACAARILKPDAHNFHRQVEPVGQREVQLFGIALGHAQAELKALHEDESLVRGEPRLDM